MGTTMNDKWLSRGLDVIRISTGITAILGVLLLAIRESSLGAWVSVSVIALLIISYWPWKRR